MPDTVVIVKGKAQTREGQTSLLADSFQNYVDVPIPTDAEPLGYQAPLIDVAPTVNGYRAAEGIPVENGEEYEMETSPLGDPDDLPPQEISPFWNELPVWAAGAQPQEVASLVETRLLDEETPAASLTKEPEPEPATIAAAEQREVGFLNETRLLREETPAAAPIEKPAPQPVSDAAPIKEAELEATPLKPEPSARRPSIATAHPIPRARLPACWRSPSAPAATWSATNSA